MSAHSPAATAQARRHVWRERALLLAPGLSLGVVIALIWVFVAWFALAKPAQLREQLQQDLAVAARSAAFQTDTLFRQAENAVRLVDLWLARRTGADPLADPGLADLVASLHRSSHHVVDVVLVRRDGQLVRLRPGQLGHSEPGASLARAEVLQLLSEQTGADLIVGLPIRLNRPALGDSWQLPMALPLTKPLDDIDVVLALIDETKLGEVHQRFAVGEEAALTMIRHDGRALSRVPELPGLIGQDVFSKHPERRALFEADEGPFTTTGEATDGRKRVGAYASLPDFGVKLLVSNTEDAALALHREQRDTLFALATLVSAGLVLLGRWLVLVQRGTRLRDAALQATSNAVSIGLFRTQSDGRIVYVNEAYLRVHGMKREDIAWGWTQLVPPEQRETLIEVWKRHMATGEPIHMVRKMKRGDDGRIRMLEVHTEPLITDGKVVGQAGTVEDITERSEQENAVRTLAAIFDMTPDFVCQIRENGDMVYLNPAGRARLGIAPDAPLTGINIGRYYARERMLEYQQEILPTAAREGHWRGRSAVLIRPGEELPIDTTMLVHRDRRGRIETLSLLMRDVSEQLRSQRERQRSEAMLLAVAHTSSALISVVDKAQQVIFLNAAFEQQHAVRRDAWMGRPLADLLGAQAYSQRRGCIERALDGQPSRIELTSAAGRELHSFELQTAPLRVQGGDIEGVICIELDTTEARREEARLRLASQTDPLTQLLNRSGFEEGSRTRLAQVHGSGQLVALLYLDLDRFKPVNDTHGHPTGDALLKAVALRMRHSLRPTDLLARLGGDEFAVLLDPIADEADAAGVAEKLLRAISNPFHIGELQLDIGVSIGFCVGQAGQLTLEGLVAEADSFLYDAKRSGRGCWRGGRFTASAEPPPHAMRLPAASTDSPAD